MSSAREANAIATKQLELRETLWPGHEPFLWNRKINKGFATIPKTMPLILKIMDELTKGAPVSSTYLTLWCQTWDNSYAPSQSRWKWRCHRASAAREGNTPGSAG